MKKPPFSNEAGFPSMFSLAGGASGNKKISPGRRRQTRRWPKRHGRPGAGAAGGHLRHRQLCRQGIDIGLGGSIRDTLPPAESRAEPVRVFRDYA
jgi:hypothetical protein